MSEPSGSWRPRRAYRDPANRMLAGVASGLARHLGRPAREVRIALVALSLLGGVGVLVYAILWALLPDPPTEAGGVAVRRNLEVGVSIGVFGVGILVLVHHLGLFLGPRLFWPLAIAAAGFLLVWWRSDDDGRADLMSPWRSWPALLRIGVAAILLGWAIWLATAQSHVQQLGSLTVAIALAIAASALAIGPWLIRLSRDLAGERSARIRSQERADVAAHLHDSVLQTLALIQRRAGDPQAVTRLARTQERELRSWLFERDRVGVSTLRAALQELVTDVEGSHDVRVELVAVGDAPATERVVALVGAAREAVVNAAKHSGAPQIDVYAEAGVDRVEIGVRDKGRGFDPARVEGDRRGIEGSIIERMRRHRGGAEVTSTPGQGTEVRVWIPLETEDD